MYTKSIPTTTFPPPPNLPPAIMNSPDNSTSSSTSTGTSQAEAAPAAVIQAEAAAAAGLRRSVTPDNGDHTMSRPKKDITNEGHSSSSSPSTSSSSAPTSAGEDPVPDILRKVTRAAESTTPSYLASYHGRLNDAPRRGSYRMSTEIGQLKYATHFLLDCLIDDQ